MEDRRRLAPMNVAVGSSSRQQTLSPCRDTYILDGAIPPASRGDTVLLDLDLRRFDQLGHILGIDLAEGGDLLEGLDDGSGTR